MKINIHSFLLGPLDNLQHLVANEETKEVIIIDPAWDADVIIQELGKNKWYPKAILLTHTHHDHVSALDNVLEHFDDLPVYIGEKEYQLNMFAIESPLLLNEGDELILADLPIKVIETPGHTKGSLCFLIGKHLISGDTLFVDGCGRCNFKESDIKKMFTSLQKLKSLPDDTVIYPGHHYGGEKISTIKKQKQTNPYLLIEKKDFFVAFRNHLQASYRSIPFAPSSAAEMKAIYQDYNN